MFSRISNIFIVCLMLIALGGVLQTAAADIEANKAIVGRFIDEALSQGNLDTVDELVAADFVHYASGKIDVEGTEQYKGFITMQRTAFPDLVVTVEDMIAEADKVAVRSTYSGTHLGGFIGIAPTGVHVTFTGICIFRIASGMIAEIWTEYDALGLMEQLGVAPPGREDYGWGEPMEVTGEPGDPEANKELAGRFHMDLFIQGNLDAAEEILAEDFTVHFSALPPELRHGIEGAKLYATGILTAFSEQDMRHVDHIAEGDKVVIRWVNTATHTGDLMGIPPTGKTVTLTGTDIFRIEDGKLAEMWQNWDQMGMLIQLGVIPPPQPPTETDMNEILAGRFHMDLAMQGNFDAAEEILAEDFEIHFPALPPEMRHGIEGAKLYLTAIMAGLPEQDMRHVDHIAEGDMVVIRFVSTATHTGDLFGIPPTGKRVTLTGIDIFRIENGKLAELWQNWDQYGTMQQLGVIPPEDDIDYGWGEPMEVTGDPGDPETNKAIAARFHLEMFNEGNMDVADEIFAEDFVFHSTSYRGPEGAKEDAIGIRTAFPDVHMTQEFIVAESDKVVIRWISRGTHEATGIPVEVTGIDIYRMQDGKIAELWQSWDKMGMIQQLTAEPEPPEGYDNVFFMSLVPGLNFISLPLEPITPYTARSFAEELSATTVIQLDESRQRFVGFTLDAPDDGFAIEGGKGYIVNVSESKVVAFTGAAWTNQPPVEAAPTLVQTDGAWAIVVSGRLEDDSTNSLKKDGYLVTVRNTRTNIVATDVVRSRYFAAAFADLTRQNVVQTGDRLEVQVRNRSGEIVSDTIPYTVTAEAIRQAFLPITLKDVFKPRQSLLLQNYPNPFNPETWIPYQLHQPAQVMIRIYDGKGGLVRTLSLGQRGAGFYLGRTRAAYWDGHNDAGEKVASGIYFYQIKAGNFFAVRKMVIVK